jgi:hypothetical protein
VLVAAVDAAVAAGDMAVVAVAVAADAVATVVAADVAAIAETEAIAAIVGRRALSRQQSGFFPKAAKPSLKKF